MSVIILTGKIGSGKTSIANLFKQKDSFQCLSIAGNLKNICSLVSKPYISEIEKSVFIPEFGMTYGTMLQQVGTYFRSLYENIWIDLVLSEIQNSENENFVIDDARFPNEIQKLKSIKNKEIYVVHLENNNSGQNDTRDKNHISETALNDFKDYDLVIDTSDFDFVKAYQEIKDMISRRTDVLQLYHQ